MRASEWVLEYPSVIKYHNRLAPTTQRNTEYYLHYFFRWMQENSAKFGDMTPDDLVEYQKNVDNGTKYDLLDALQDYIVSLEGRHSYKKIRYTAVRGFFKANRAELPSDDFNIKGDKPKVQGRLSPENLKHMVLSCKPSYRAMYLCMFAGGMGQDEAVYWSDNGAAKLIEDLKKDPEYIRVALRGRKSRKNIQPYYTLILGDALDELKKWMAERPPEADAIFTNQFGDPITKKAIYTYWLRHMQSLSLIKVGEDSSHRTGRNLHELRDLFRTQWEKSPAKGSVAEYAMGHQIDPLEYNKAYRDERWVVKEFRKAVPMLNIMSSGRPFGQVDEDEIESLQKQVNYLTAELKKYTDVTPEHLTSIIDTAVKAALEAERVKATLEAERKKG